MPFIQFPNVPNAPGVPALVRPLQSSIASSPTLVVALGAVQNILGQAFQQTPRWGIFYQSGGQLGIDQTSATAKIVGAVASQLTGSVIAQLSTLDFGFTKEAEISDYPLEENSFASYNKVVRATNPIVSFAFTGSESDRTSFLNAIDTAVTTTNLYNVVTPEVTYVDYSVKRYSYQRRADRGLTMLLVEVELQEIRQTTTQTSRVAASPVVQPQPASAASTVDAGKVQSPVPDVSTLKSMTNKFFGVN